MYIPEHFNQPDREKAIAFIRANGFGQLISMLEGKLCSSHLPFMLTDDGATMFCHLARQNPQWHEIENQQVLITFQGPHDYISPSWYSTPGVPTWNYQAVHVYGSCQIIDSPNELKKIVERLTHLYESKFDTPWKPEYSEALFKGIVGLEIKVSEIQCKYKLSQNRSGQDREQVISALEEQGANALALAMKQEKLIKEQ